MINNILIIGRSNIGDVCYDLALVSAVCKHFSNARISFLTSSNAENIAQGYPGISSVFTFDKHKKDKGLIGRLRLISRLNKQKFSLVIVLRNTLMYKFLNAPVSWIFRAYCRKHRLPLNSIHIMDAYAQFLMANNVRANLSVYDFKFTREEENFAESFLNRQNIDNRAKFITILPFSAWTLKNWPIEKWNRLSGMLKRDYQIKLINLSKVANSDFARDLAKQISREIISGEKTTLKQAMAVIKRSSLFIGPDSSLLHLSSCLGVETIGLYGPTSTERFYPYFHRKSIVVAKKKRDCVFCYPHGKKRLCGKDVVYGACMEDIQIEDVFEKIKQKLKL